jgi:hypothetical protein
MHFNQFFDTDEGKRLVVEGDEGHVLILRCIYTVILEKTGTMRCCLSAKKFWREKKNKFGTIIPVFIPLPHQPLVTEQRYFFKL